MSEMKLIMERWDKYLVEEESEVISSENGEPSDEQMEVVQNFIKSLFVVMDAREDAEKVQAESTEQQFDEGAGRKNRMARKQRQQRTKEIKKLAGVAGIKFKDFTPEQQALYDEEKRKYMEQLWGSTEDVKQAAIKVQTSLYTGDVRSTGLAKLILKDKNNNDREFLNKALVAIVGDACAEMMTIACIIGAYAAKVAEQGGS